MKAEATYLLKLAEYAKSDQTKPAPQRENPFEAESRSVQKWRQDFMGLKGLGLFWFSPAAAFFLAMIQHGHPDAAVFAMALAAIYVAGEHYSTLENQKNQVEELGEISAKLSENTENIANALGKKNALSEMYRLYSIVEATVPEPVTHTDQKPPGADAEPTDLASATDDQEPVETERDIFAIFRRFDIDNDWWKAQSWDSFCSDEQKGTLYHALVTGKRKNLLFVVPFTFYNPDVLPIDKRSEQFENFMGLMWFCVVLWHVRRTLAGENPKHRIVMADTSLWVHVVDGEVHQIIDQPGNDLAVRNLSLNIGPRDVPLAEWARREIKELSTRGPLAEEYICSRLCAVFPPLLQTDLELKAQTTPILEALGIEGWLEKFESPADRRNREKRCGDIVQSFSHLIALRRENHNPQVRIDCSHSGRSLFLADEVQ